MNGKREIDYKVEFILVSRLLLVLFTPLGTYADGVAKSPSTETAEYCNARCLAKCARENGNTSPGTDCKAKCTYDGNLCATGDHNCWRTCRNTLDPSDQSNAPRQPSNVTVAYVHNPQPTPWKADLQWQSVENAYVYIIQYLDKSDQFKSWDDGGAASNISFTSYWTFVRPDLCPEYEFRIAAVNEYGASSFSEIVNLPSPKPVIPAAQYSVKSAVLLDEPFIDPAIDSVPLDNKTVQLEISFVPPPHWSMKRDIKRVVGNLHVLFCDRIETFSPYIRWKAGEPSFEVRLPGAMAAAQASCKMIFAVENIYTRCNEMEPVPYPELIYDAAARQSLPGFSFGLSCKNIHRSVCPYVPISSEPACGVASYRVQSQREDNYTTDATATIGFSQLLAPKDAPLLKYLVRYGELGSPDPSMPQTFLLPNLTDEKVVTLPNTTRDFNLSNLDVRKSYAFQICAMYDEKTEPKWNQSVAYQIDMSNLLRPEDFTADAGRAHGSDRRVATYVVAVSVPVIVALVVLLAVCTFVILRLRRAKGIDEIKVRPQGWDDERYIDLPDKVDKWEMDRADIIIYDDQKLGSGAFGSVFKCKLLRLSEMRREDGKSVLAEYRARRESGEAAVKLLPEFADETSKSDFRREINLMKKLGYHERLVNMLGCVTVSEPLCLVVEYCDGGDLLHYLRDRRNYMIQLEEKGIDLNNLSEKDQVNLEMVLCFKDLLAFSWQISVGLEYLSQRGYIHRDVAARNILVDKGKKAKIGDFGLCRYGYDDSVYLSQGGRLPIKWMALEAIRNYEFTTKSDVWSYGVLLFEIITMGGNPYPGLQPTDLEAYLEVGKRMEQPDNCPAVLYAMMLDCWRTHPDERPTFSDLRERIRVLLEEVTFDYSYLNLNQARDYYNVIPMEYPAITSVPRLTTPNTTIKIEQVNEENDRQHQSRDLQTDGTDEGATVTGSSCGSSTSVTPSGTVTADQHRDSAGSDQFLITPTTPKFKFFKFKGASSKNGLAALPEASSGSSDDTTSGGLAYSNGTYIEDLLPHPSSIDHQMQNTAIV